LVTCVEEEPLNIQLKRMNYVGLPTVLLFAADDVYLFSCSHLLPRRSGYQTSLRDTRPTKGTSKSLEHTPSEICTGVKSVPTFAISACLLGCDTLSSLWAKQSF